jgi:hypothetical protein
VLEVPAHFSYAATCEAQFAMMADFVAASSVTPALVHFSCIAAQSKYVWKLPPHFGSPRTPSH